MVPEDNNRRTTSFLAAAALGLLSAIFFYFVLAVGAAAVLVTWAKLSNPGDPSAGDAAGWALLMLGPFFLLFDALVSLVLGAIVASKVYGRR